MVTPNELLNVSSLKVAELKDELSKRGLPTNGLKKDLAERLQNAIDGDEKVEENGADGGMEEKVEVEPAEADTVVMEATKIKEDERGGQSPIAPLEAEAEPEPESELEPAVIDIPAAQGTSTKQALIEEVVPQQMVEPDTTPTMEEKVESTDGIEPDLRSIRDEKSAEGKESSVAEDVQVTSEEMNIQPDQAQNLFDDMGQKLVAEDVEVVELGTDPENEIEIEAETQEEEIFIGDAAKEGENQDIAMVEEKKELSSYHPHGVSPHSAPPTMLTSEEASKAKALSDLDEEVRKVGGSSRSLYISGLVRPLTLPAFRVKVEEYGPLEDDSSVWLDGVKTHAYVTYEKSESASRAREAMSGTIYPPDTGKEIQVQYIPDNIVKQCISIEDLAWQEERGKMDLRARIAGNSLLYSLHRFETNPVSNVAEPRPPKVSSLNDRVAPQAGRQYDRQINQSRMDWGSSRSKNFYDIGRRGDYVRRDYRGDGSSRDGFNDYRGNRDDYRDSERSNSNRGSSKAEERVREVEARIMAERARGERSMVQREGITSPPYNNGRSNGNFASDKNRWSSRETTSSRREAEYSRSSHSDRRREYSPPPPRREYLESSGRDEFGRDRHRRD